MSSAPVTDVRGSQALTENGTIGITAPSQAVIQRTRRNASGDVVYGRQDNAVMEDAEHGLPTRPNRESVARRMAISIRHRWRAIQRT